MTRLVFTLVLPALLGSAGCSRELRDEGTAIGDRRLEVIAHRGFSGAAPENTLAAIRAAIDLGADRVEFDVLLTKDGVPVVIHDADLRRTTDGRGKVAGRTLEEVRALDAGGWFSPRFRGEKVPTLDEALDLCRGRIAVNVEIKGEAVDRSSGEPMGGIEAKVVEALRRRGLLETAVVSSFDPLALERVRRLEPRIALESLFDAKHPAGSGPREVCAAVGSRSFNCSKDDVTAEWIAEARAAGLQVKVYTADEPADLERLIGMGVDGIFTDRPDRLMGILRRKVR